MLASESEHRQRTGLENLASVPAQKALESRAVLKWLSHVGCTLGGQAETAGEAGNDYGAGVGLLIIAQRCLGNKHCFWGNSPQLPGRFCCPAGFVAGSRLPEAVQGIRRANQDRVSTDRGCGPINLVLGSRG